MRMKEVITKRNDTFSLGFAALNLIAAIGVAIWLTGCGFTAQMYPVTEAHYDSSWQPEHVRCLWGDCSHLQK